MIFFWYFFGNFHARVEFERNLGLKFFSRFLGLSHPVLAKNSAEKGIFNFLNFFAIFFRNFIAWVECERNSWLKVFSRFLGLSHPVLARNNAGKRFLIFWIFLLFFSEFSYSGRARKEFTTKIFFSLSRPIPSRYG